jgi:hypothetical protein
MAGKEAKATILPTAATTNTAIAKNAKAMIKKRQHKLEYLLAVPTLLHYRAFYKYTWDPIRKIRRTKENDKNLIKIIKAFVDDKYAELQSVQVAVST